MLFCPRNYKLQSPAESSICRNHYKRQYPASAATLKISNPSDCYPVLVTAIPAIAATLCSWQQSQRLLQLCRNNSNSSDCCNCPSVVQATAATSKDMLLLMTWHVCHVSVSVFIQVKRRKLFESSKSNPFHVFNVQSVKIAFFSMCNSRRYSHCMRTCCTG